MSLSSSSLMKGQRVHRCDECGKELTRVEHLQRHIREVHLGERRSDRKSNGTGDPEQPAGSNLAGAASGALLGPNTDGGEGFRTAGTLEGMVTGAWIGQIMERSFKDKRQEKQDSEQGAVNSAKREQDRYDEEYTKVANAAPGYGSVLLPTHEIYSGPSYSPTLYTGYYGSPITSGHMSAPVNTHTNNTSPWSGSAPNYVGLGYSHPSWTPPISQRKHECRWCSKVFTRNERLQRHLKNSHGPRYACGSCPKVFNRLDNLQQHIRTHHNKLNDDTVSTPLPPEVREEMFECGLCTKNFTGFEDIQRHRRETHGDRILAEHKLTIQRNAVRAGQEEIFQCLFCGCCLYSKGSLEGHIRVAHSHRKKLDSPVLKSTSSTLSYGSQERQAEPIRGSITLNASDALPDSPLGMGSLSLRDAADVAESSGVKLFAPIRFLNAARTGDIDWIRAFYNDHQLPSQSFADDQGRTSMLLAALNGHDQICEELLKYHPQDINTSDIVNQTPLIAAAKNGHDLVAKTLLCHAQIDVHLKDVHGRDALSYAAEGGFLGLVRLLVDHGANMNSKDLNHRTPRSWAKLNGRQSVMDLLDFEKRGQDDRDVFTDSGYASNSTVIVARNQSESTDDACTVYSFGSVAKSEKISYQLAFVRDLLKTLQMRNIDTQYLVSLTSTLLDLLQAFAFKIAVQQKEHDAMFFILKYRSEIVNTLQDQWEQNERTSRQSQPNAMYYDERVRQWQAKLAVEPPTAPVEELEELVLEEIEHPITAIKDSVTSVHDLNISLETDLHPVNLDFLSSSSAYAWLVDKLVDQSYLSVPVTDNITGIQTAINRHFKPNKVTRQTPRNLCVMALHLDWDLLDFLKKYHFEGTGNYPDILRTYITITSDGKHVQALTALQYLEQISSQFGKYLLDLVIDIADQGRAFAVFGETAIEGGIVHSKMCFDIKGSASTLAEIGQLLIWMGSVFRTSPERGVVYNCLASTRDPKHHTITFKGNISNSGPTKTWCCNIVYNLNKTTTTLPGNCWYSLFEYAVIAQGYPIARRKDTVQGLEMSLGVMLALCQAEHIVQHDGKLVIKGFSRMLSLSKHEQGASVWHFSNSTKHEYISYSEAVRGTDISDVSARQVLEDRHFVGWCEESIYGIGAVNNKYQVQESCLSYIDSGHHLFGKEVRRGFRPSVETICIADNRATPRPTSARNFHERLMRIHARPVVLWDVETQRGWLTNGSSALLHLVLTSIEPGDDDDPFTSRYCLRKTDIKQRMTNTDKAAAWILLDEHNLRLLFLRGTGQCLRTRIEDICLDLELMIEHQLTIPNNTSVSNVLEGWDFMDIANTARNPVYPRFVVPGKDCTGWMTLLKDTNAITLFGNNFGELLAPKGTQSCSYWSTVPTKQFYLAASIGDLESITKIYNGDSKIVPRRLTHSTIWPLLEKTFAVCNCSSTLEGHLDKIQVLVPTSILTAKPKLDDIMDCAPKTGAVIFGGLNPVWCRPNYHTQFSCLSRKRRRSVSDSEFRDSALGESISSAEPSVESGNA